ncbi:MULTISPECIES: phosphoglycerate kinase [Prauserella salsuginis group]|uniref:Phosphoglycerate kinase n=1 Tax=Prauserella salsuginis TaxID=387889 RepID=A0ABW6GBI8_9PSEU|nr:MULTISPECIES: phosphoglycerate kinase [Prauserella salsuginis group]MCR3722999.1 phosphoglycerate kinase [Prauserella flava]MCR3737325.1 phosphoglycerate kinase [Prauserella salsuginis]
MAVKSLDDLLSSGGTPANEGVAGGGVAGRYVLVRSDLNVPLDGATITDDGRVRAALPTIRRLAEAGARVVVTAHLGRPKGAPDDAYSLRPVAARLGELLGSDVPLAGDVVGREARDVTANLADGQVAMLENVRFDPRETSKDADERGELARELAALVGSGAAFVSDGFGVVHRKQASVYDIARELPAYAGGLVLSELEVLRTLTGDPQRPYAVVLGGSKVSDKLAVIEALLPKVDRLLVGGGMCFTFLAAQGQGVGSSLLEADMVEVCKRLLAEAGDKLVLPVDVVAADAFSADAATRTVGAGEIEEGWMGLDIGPESVRRFADAAGSAATVFWNGPMGVFEMAPFAGGTRGVAQAIADGGAFSVVGGGDSAAAVRLLGLPEDGFSHISTGGGASLEYLEGKDLPGVAVLGE